MRNSDPISSFASSNERTRSSYTTRWPTVMTRSGSTKSVIWSAGTSSYKARRMASTPPFTPMMDPARDSTARSQFSYFM